MTQERIAAEVRAELARKNRSQGDLCAALGWSEAYLSRRLTGAVSFRIDELERIAAELGVPLKQIAKIAS
jgi:transcriptional regulator with XRE-family HTH domain